MGTLIFLCIAGFCAAFVDSIAGGGGVISLPAFLLAGLPPHHALGTNKFSSTTGSFTSTISYAKAGKIDKKLMFILAPFTLIGASLGVNTVLKLNQKTLSYLVIGLVLFVGLYSLFSKKIGQENKFVALNSKNITLGILLAFALGFYDGFFGPGTGSFLIFGLISIYGYDFLNASGNAKVLNFVSNITSLILFALNKSILVYYGIPAAIFMVIGARVGSKMALKKGAKLIKPIFITMSLAVALKLLFDIITKY